MSISNFDKLVGIGIAGCLLYIGITVADVAKKIKFSVKDLSDKTEVDIPSKIVERAVNEAISREARNAAKNAADEIIRNAKCDIGNAVCVEVNAVKNDIRAQVSEKLAREISTMNTYAFKNEVCDAAKDAMVEKFSKDLDDITEK